LNRLARLDYLGHLPP
ncbi:hypothetical protein EE612_009775, partial [Oryza sativa]